MDFFSAEDFSVIELLLGRGVLDLDHPQSALGNRCLGCKSSWDGFFLLGLLSRSGSFFVPLAWICAGAGSLKAISSLLCSSPDILGPFQESSSLFPYPRIAGDFVGLGINGNVSAWPNTDELLAIRNPDQLVIAVTALAVFKFKVSKVLFPEIPDGCLHGPFSGSLFKHDMAPF